MNNFVPKLSWTGYVHELAQLLRNREIETPLYLVGGAVRDAYLRRAVTDVDIAVDGDAAGLARQVADWLGADVYVMDRERGVARVFIRWKSERICVDFARFRGSTLAEDLRDRDFTMNAMAADLLGDFDVLIDPYGGAADLQQKVLRRCAPNAIRNDPIRALRAIRLSTQFQLRIHPDTAADIRAHLGTLRDCSAERIRDEFFKLLGLDQAARGLRVLLHLGVLQQILPSAQGTSDDEQGEDSAVAGWSVSLLAVERLTAILKAISRRRTDNTAAAFDLGTLVIQLDRFRESLQAHIERSYGGARSHAELLILAALLHNWPDIDVAILKLSAEEERKLNRAIANIQLVTATERWTVLDQHRFWHTLRDSGIDVILLAAAEYLAMRGNALKQHDWLNLVETVTALLDVYFNRYDEMVDPRLQLDGNDIQEQLRIKPGPLVGRLLNALREAQVTGEINTLCEAREFVRRQAETRDD